MVALVYCLFEGGGGRVGAGGALRSVVLILLIVCQVEDGVLAERKACCAYRLKVDGLTSASVYNPQAYG